MAHRATLYSVRIKEKWHDYRPLGNIDEEGTWLSHVLADTLQTTSSSSARAGKRSCGA